MKRTVLASVLLAAATGAAALTVTPEVCREGSEFIGNAARARDNGLPAEEFLRRLEEDLVVIQAFPPELRWFAQDDDDAALLRAAAASVFASPKSAEDHEAEFVKRCNALSELASLPSEGRKARLQ